MRIAFATHNEHKLGEIRAILAGSALEPASLAELGISDEPEENGETFEENALIKAAHAARRTGLPALADDSGLEIDALGKYPGVYSSRFLGVDTPYEIKNRVIINMLAGIPQSGRGARFVCAVAAVLPGGGQLTTRGVIEGYIADAPSGENGFGYDPIFVSQEHGITTANMPPDLKNAVSHRGRALEAMKAKLAEVLA